MSDFTSPRSLNQRQSTQQYVFNDQHNDQLVRRSAGYTFQDEENYMQKKHKGCIILIVFFGSLLFLVYSMTSKQHLKQHPQPSTLPQSQISTLNRSPVLNITYIQQKPVSKSDGQFLYSQFQQAQKIYGDSFDIPKIIWIFDEGDQKNRIQKLNIKKTKIYAQMGGYTVKTITLQNYQRYLERQDREQVDYYIDIAKKRKQVFYFSGQNKLYVKQLIVLAILQEEGGIFIDNSLTLTEPLNWISQIHKQSYINSVNKSTPPQFFGFHNVRKSSLPTKIFTNIKKPAEWRVVKPAIQPYFIATYPRTKFITQVNIQFKNLMAQNHSQIFPKLFQLVTEWNERIFRLDSSMRGNLFQIASLLVFIQRQKKYDVYGGPNKLHAIDFYGIKTINQNYFPRKIQAVLDERTVDFTYYHMTQVQQNQLEMMTGPLRYMIALAPLERYNSLVQKSIQGDQSWPVYKSSFLQKHLFSNLQQIKIRQYPLKVPALRKQWNSLPRKIWIYWNVGIQNSTITHQLCSRNIHDFAKKSGFQYHELTKKNLHQYLDKEIIKNITEVFQNSPHNPPEQIFSDFVRLSILHKYGGIYLDASFILLEDLSWLVNITNETPELIYNRYGKHPKVFMFYNPQYGNAMTESIRYDQKYNTKAGWHLGYENNFIAAEAGAELIKDWLDQFTLYHTLQYSKIKPIHDQCGLGSHAWTHDKSSYLFEMDAIKCVIGRKEKEFQKNTNDKAVSLGSKYYKIWSMNGYFGVQKLRSFANIENIDSQDNFFLTNDPLTDVEKVMGMPFKAVKFFGMESKLLSFFLYRRFKDIHPQSLVSKYILPYKHQNQTIGITKEVPILIEKEDP